MDELLKLKQQMIEALQSENESLKHKNNILEMMLKEYSTQVKMLARKNNNQLLLKVSAFLYIFARQQLKTINYD